MIESIRQADIPFHDNNYSVIARCHMLAHALKSADYDALPAELKAFTKDYRTLQDKFTPNETLTQQQQQQQQLSPPLHHNPNGRQHLHSITTQPTNSAQALKHVMEAFKRLNSSTNQTTKSYVTIINTVYFSRFTIMDPFGEPSMDKYSIHDKIGAQPQHIITYHNAKEIAVITPMIQGLFALQRHLQRELHLNTTFLKHNLNKTDTEAYINYIKINYHPQQQQQQQNQQQEANQQDRQQQPDNDNAQPPEDHPDMTTQSINRPTKAPLKDILNITPTQAQEDDKLLQKEKLWQMLVKAGTMKPNQFGRIKDRYGSDDENAYDDRNVLWVMKQLAPDIMEQYPDNTNNEQFKTTYKAVARLFLYYMDYRIKSPKYSHKIEYGDLRDTGNTNTPTRLSNINSDQDISDQQVQTRIDNAINEKEKKIETLQQENNSLQQKCNLLQEELTQTKAELNQANHEKAKLEEKCENQTKIITVQNKRLQGVLDFFSQHADSINVSHVAITTSAQYIEKMKYYTEQLDNKLALSNPKPKTQLQKDTAEAMEAAKNQMEITSKSAKEIQVVQHMFQEELNKFVNQMIDDEYNEFKNIKSKYSELIADDDEE